MHNKYFHVYEKKHFINSKITWRVMINQNFSTKLWKWFKYITVYLYFDSDIPSFEMYIYSTISFWKKRKRLLKINDHIYSPWHKLWNYSMEWKNHCTNRTIYQYKNKSHEIFSAFRKTILSRKTISVSLKRYFRDWRKISLNSFFSKKKKKIPYFLLQ